MPLGSLGLLQPEATQNCQATLEVSCSSEGGSWALGPSWKESLG